MEFLRVRLAAARSAGPELVAFYGDRLGLEQLGEAEFRIGASELEFVPGDGDPYYHFAFLVPGNRFEAALEWALERVEILPRQSGELVFDFSFWDALACYFQDPAGSIVELIAHRGLGESEVTGPFEPRELLGFSEVGLVGDMPQMARDLEPLDLRLWDGTVDDPGSLAFVGEQARTLILCPVGRLWLPIDRPAEPHPVDAVLSGEPEGTVETGAHRVSRAPQS